MSRDGGRDRSRPVPGRIPPFVVVILGAAVGFVFANWLGAVLGGILGGIIWWGRTRE